MDFGDLGLPPEEPPEDQGEGAAGGETPPPWQTALEEMRQQQEENNLRMAAVLGEVMKAIKPAPAAPATTTPPVAPTSDADVFKLAQQFPEVMPQLIEEKAGRIFETRAADLRASLLRAVEQRDVEKTVSSRLRELYAEDLGDRESEILRETPAAKKLLENFLDPSVKGTPIHDELAYLMAAAMKPSAVAKREVSRAKAQEAQRAAALERASSLGLIGGSRNARPKEPVITDEDKALAERLGINLADEKVQARILKYKATEHLAGLGGGTMEVAG